MSTGTFLLFFAGLLVTWAVATIVGRRLTEGDRFEEETVNERLAHLEQRLYTHRRWWQSGILVGALSVYVMVVGMFFVQNVAEQVETSVREREEQAAEERLRNQCQFREFVQEFFTQLGESQFTIKDLNEIPGFAELDPATKTFVTSLVIGIAEDRITIEEAREAYIATFPTKDCE